MVQATARLEDVRLLGGQDQIHGRDGATGHGRGDRVHLRERGAIAGTDAGLGSLIRIACEGHHRVDISRFVQPPQLIVAGRLGGEEAGRAGRSQEVDAGTEAAWRERVLRPEVVSVAERPVDDERQRVLQRMGHSAVRSQPMASVAAAKASRGVLPVAMPAA